MEQQQIKVKFSVTTKLLISVVLLLFTVILFLNISTIFLVTEDKRAYTYQAQSTETILISREFMNKVKRSLDLSRLALGSIDPFKPVQPHQETTIRAMLNNQSEVPFLQLGVLNTNTFEVKTLTHVRGNNWLKDSDLQEEDFKLTAEQIKIATPQLLDHAYSFINVSSVSKTPVIAVLLADIKYKSNNAGLPISVAYTPLNGFGMEGKGSNLTITDREGWVLFDNDPAAFFNKKNISDDALFGIATASKLTAGAQEYESQQTSYLGSYVRPGFDLVVLTRIEKRKAMRATYTLAERYFLLGIMATAGAIIFAILFAKTMTAPLGRLYQATKEVSEGNFNIELKINARDEIGALAGSFVTMSRKIKELIQESIRKVHLENELAIASTVQQTLIPPPKYENDFISIYSQYKSADQCGGDWWGFFGTQDKLCLMIADATGHGLPSALITASARSCVSVLHKLAQEDPEFSFSPGAMLSYANRVVFDAASGKIMMTFFTAVIDFTKKTLTYANAGHNPAWLFKKENDKYSLKSLMSVGQRLGEALDVPGYEEKTVPISPGDILFLYTDGLLEGTNSAGEMYGKSRARRTVEASVGQGPENIINTLMKDFMSHNGTKALDDDISLAVAKILPKGLIT